MGWNGAAGANGVPAKPLAEKPAASRGGLPPSLVKGLVAGLVVIVGALVAFFLLSGGDAKKPTRDDTKKTAKIKEVVPAAAPKPKTEVVLSEEDKRKKEITDIEAKWAGKEMPKSVAVHLYYLKNPPVTTMKVEVPHQYLRHPSERAIASVVLVEPGTEFLDVLQYGESFDRDFINAMLDKIEVGKDDDEVTRNVKDSVTDIKKEIARICKEEGRKPSQVMNEYAKMMYDLGKYEANLRAELNEKRRDPNLSDADVRDFFQAANKLLEAKGLKPLAVPTLAKRGLVLANRAARLAAEASAGKDE